MPLKFVYVLVSDASVFYAEQAAVSMHTLRLHNPRCRIVVATDEKSLDFLTGSRSPVTKYADEYVIVNSPSDFTLTQRSRFIKTSLRQEIAGDFLYLDSDTVVTGSLAELENINCDVAAVYAKHTDFRTLNRTHPIMHRYYQLRGTDPGERYEPKDYFNGGVILCRDTGRSHLLFGKWHEFWLKSATAYDYNYDQADLWRANACLNNVIVELDGAYNCQMICEKEVLRYIHQCKIFHYFSSSCRCWSWLNDAAVLLDIRNNGISVELEKRTGTLTDEFLDNVAVISGEELTIYNMPLVATARRLSGMYLNLMKKRSGRH